METNPGYLLSDSARLLRKTFDQRVRSLGITAVQARLLLILEKFPDQNQAFYAERIEVEPITLTRIVDRLEDAGWIERAADPLDRRARLLRLTAKSEGILESIREKVDGLVDHMLIGFTEVQTAMLAELLGKVSQNLSQNREIGEVVNG